jgi:dipeptidyl aminopeptidase/acylaminoacyl peptidase
MALPDLIPLDILFGNPERSEPRISPDGTKLAYLAPDEGVLNVWVGAVGSQEFKPVTHDRLRGIHQYEWAYDGRHILYLQDIGGDENWRLHTVDLETGEDTDRTPFDGVQTQMLGLSDRVPHEVVVGMNRDNPQLHDVYRLDLRTGELTKEVENPGFDGWLVDNDLVVRAGTKPLDNGGMQHLLRKGDDWEVAIDVDPDDFLINVTHLIGFSQDGRRVFHVSVEGSDKARLVAYNTETGKTDELAEDPDFDVFYIGFLMYTGLLHPRTREPQLVPVLKDRLEYIVLDESLQADLDALRAVEDGEIYVVSRDLEDKTWIVAFGRDDGPGRYYSYDRASKKATFLFENQPALSKYKLANVEPFTFTSRDGLTVHGYLTFPPGLERKDLPAVLHVHGGPWGGRHMWGFDSMNQWIANRGYACIEIDYRGSGGYGKAFLNASAREWAGKMHDDLIDGVEWVADKGWIDRDRVGIFGGSYGGYAALVGATFTPDFFRCAVDYVGPSNLITLLKSIPPYWVLAARQFDKLLGNIDTDGDFLWERSPLSRVDQIQIPILIAQGANDPRVKQAESEQIVEAMKERGLPYEYLLFEDEGHGFVRPENEVKFHLASERFLAKHLGGRAQT